VSARRESETDIRERFATAAGSAKPSPERISASVDMRESVIDVAVTINDAVPDGRWKSLALTALEEALMWANKGLFNQKDES
jgi:hypothetical protein